MTGIRLKNTLLSIAGPALLFLTQFSQAQTLVHVREFYSLSGTVQFLPGGYVSKVEEGKTENYLYTNSKFETFRGELPSSLRNWRSFDWESGIDYLDQISLENFDPDLKRFLPKRAKVKKVLTIPETGSANDLVLVCYTLRSTEQFTRPDATDIFVMAALEKKANDNNQANFRKLWTVKVKPDSSYGDFQYQTVENAGPFILLYSAAPGGDSVDDMLDVYRISEGTQAETPATSVSSQ